MLLLQANPVACAAESSASTDQKPGFKIEAGLLDTPVLNLESANAGCSEAGLLSLPRHRGDVQAV
jgi:hypothetical protein